MPDDKETSTTKSDKQATQGRVTPGADHDRVVMASRAPDGSPAQFDPEYIGDKETVEKGAIEQLSQQKASAVDQAKRGVVDTGGVLAGESGEGVGSTEPDPAVSEIAEAHKDAKKEAEKQAKAEVSKLHAGLGDK